MKFIKKFFLFYDLLRKRRIGSYLQDTTNLLNKSGKKKFYCLKFFILGKRRSREHTSSQETKQKKIT